jgi:hypothetical protein
MRGLVAPAAAPDGAIEAATSTAALTAVRRRRSAHPRTRPAARLTGRRGERRRCP